MNFAIFAPFYAELQWTNELDMFAGVAEKSCHEKRCRVGRNRRRSRFVEISFERTCR
jgi:hypothetical protein